MSFPDAAGRRVLAILPHPDDEAYSAAGTLARAVAGGAAVTLFAATHGEHGVDHDTHLSPGADLAIKRARELTAAAAVLGAGPSVVLDLPDTALSEVDPNKLLDVLVLTIRARVPDVVVTLGFDGAYGHKDHLALTAAVFRAVRTIDRDNQRARLEGAEPTPAPRLLLAAFPQGLFAPLHRGLRRFRGGALVAEMPESAIGVAREAADLVVDIRAVRDTKLATIAAHRSQLRDGDPRSLLGPGVVDALLDEEWFTCAAGPPLPAGATSPFAGLPARGAA